MSRPLQNCGNEVRSFCGSCLHRRPGAGASPSRVCTNPTAALCLRLPCRSRYRQRPEDHIACSLPQGLRQGFPDRKLCDRCAPGGRGLNCGRLWFVTGDAVPSGWPQPCVISLAEGLIRSAQGWAEPQFLCSGSVADECCPGAAGSLVRTPCLIQ